MLQVEVKAVFVLKSKEKQCGTDQVTGRGKSSVCVTGGELEASEGASQASGGSKQADSRNHTSSSPGAGLNPRQETPPTGGQGSIQTSCSQIEQSGTTLSTCDSVTGIDQKQL